MPSVLWSTAIQTYEPHLIAFFDDLASRWDSLHAADETAAQLDRGLAELAPGPDERVLDVGCGTGSLTMALLRRLGPHGSVVAVDLSKRMLEKARDKIHDPRVQWVEGPVESVQLGAQLFDRVLCFGVWPHIAEPNATAARIHRLLRPQGLLHIWHLLPRTRINAIHANAGPAVCSHLLAPAQDVSRLLCAAGFAVTRSVDDEERYLISARAASGKAA